MSKEYRKSRCRKQPPPVDWTRTWGRSRFGRALPFPAHTWYSSLWRGCRWRSLLRCQGLVWQAGCQENLLGSYLLGCWWHLGEKSPARAPAKLWRVSATGCSPQKIRAENPHAGQKATADRKKHLNQEKQSLFHLCSSVLAMCPPALWWDCPPGVHVWQPNSHYNTVKRWDFEEMIGSTLTSGLMLLSREWGCGNKDVFGPLLMHGLSCPTFRCDMWPARRPLSGVGFLTLYFLASTTV